MTGTTISELATQIAHKAFNDMCQDGHYPNTLGLNVNGYDFQVEFIEHPINPGLEITYLGDASMLGISITIRSFFEPFLQRQSQAHDAILQAFGSGRSIIESFKISGVDVNRCTRSGYKPVALAAHFAMKRMGVDMVDPRQRNDQLLRVLIFHGAEVHQHEFFERNTATHVAAYLGDPELLERELQTEADCNAKTQYGWTPMMYLAHKPQMDEGDIRCFELLMQASVDLNITTTNQQSALHFAVLANNSDMAIKLILAGANLNPVNGNSRRAITPLQCALLHGKYQVATVLARAELMSNGDLASGENVNTESDEEFIHLMTTKCREEATEANIRYRGPRLTECNVETAVSTIAKLLGGGHLELFVEGEEFQAPPLPKKTKVGS